MVDLVALYFPGLLILGTGAMFVWFIVEPRWWRLVAACTLPYALPLFLYRALTWLTPIEEGASKLEKGAWSSWFIAYRLQVIYAFLPVLEGVLFSVPGLFSLWLRAWGSRVGRRVFWAATAQVADRGHLDIADDVFFGNGVVLSPHLVQRRGARGVLYIKRITIGRGCFIGANCRMGPGVVVHDHARVPLLTDLYVKEEFPKPSEAA